MRDVEVLMDNAEVEAGTPLTGRIVINRFGKPVKRVEVSVRCKQTGSVGKSPQQRQRDLHPVQLPGACGGAGNRWRHGPV
jgi:hypothetical protein